MIFTGLTWAIPWWIMDYNTNCNSGNSIHFIIDLNVGVCEVSEHAEFNHKHCIRWDDKKDWEDIDQQTGYDTTQYATEIFPHVLRLRSAYSTAIIIQMLTSIISLCRPIYSLQCQYFIVLISIIYVLIVAAIQVVTGDNDIVEKEVWKTLTGCDKGSSVPYVSYYSLNFAQVFGMIIVLISIVPNRIVCFQFVAPSDGLRPTMSSNSDCNYPKSFSQTVTTPMNSLHDPIIKISYSIESTLPSPPELSIDMSPIETKIIPTYSISIDNSEINNYNNYNYQNNLNDDKL